MRRLKVEVTYEADIFGTEYAVLKAEKTLKYTTIPYQNFKLLFPGPPNFIKGKVFFVWTVTGAKDS